jgi:hypothetical protein
MNTALSKDSTVLRILSSVRLPVKLFAQCRRKVDILLERLWCPKRPDYIIAFRRGVIKE